MRVKHEKARASSGLRGRARPTNVTLNAALVDEAKALGVNISLAAASGLEQAVAKYRAEIWAEENAAALASYNDFVEENGLPLEKSRLF
ncbi:MAG: type II toxin-antitoxin system CcdA family antitoxin [Sphingomicrobium sp.]